MKNTKEQRIQSRKYQFEKLIEDGYLQETYKGLDFFTKEDGKYFTLKVYRGTAANHEEFVNYRTAERRSEAIQNYKNNYESRQAYKAEQKAKGYTSSHAGASAAIKAELKKIFPNIKFSVRSDSFAGGDSVHIEWTDGATREQIEAISSKYQYGNFNGMEDIYEYTNRREDIPQVKYVQEHRNLSDAIIKQVAEELQKIKHYTPEELNSYRDNPEHEARQILYATSIPNNYTNLKVIHNDDKFASNFYKIVFDVPQAAEVKETEIKEVKGKIQVIDYSEKSFALIGETKPIKDQLKQLGGSFNPRLNCGAGWIFSKRKLDDVKAFLIAHKQKATQETEQTKEIAKVQQIDIYKREANGAFNIPCHLTIYNSSGQDVTNIYSLS